MSDELTHVLTQTHRHYRSDMHNLISISEARDRQWPLIADCGTVWIPGQEWQTDDLPLCQRCKSAQGRPLATRGPRHGRPTYVYRCYDADDRLIYVGCTVSPVQRMDQHRQTSWWHEQVARTRFIVFPNRDYALSMERQAIADENPRWNVRGRDRALWTADDYRDAHFAMLKKGAAETRVHKLRLEALRRFNLDLLEETA